VVSTAGVAHAEGGALAVQSVIWADLAIFCSGNKGDEAGRVTEEHDNCQNKKGPGHQVLIPHKFADSDESFSLYLTQG